MIGRGISPEPAGATPPTSGLPTPPIVGKVEALLGQGHSREAALIAYQTAEDDVRRAFGMKLPRQWTHREFLRKYLRADMGYVGVLLTQLHTIFEPIRYGVASDVPAALMTDLLRSLYQEPALRKFLPFPTNAPSSSSAPDSGRGGAPSVPKAGGTRWGRS